VWGEQSSDDPILLLDGHPLQIRASLWQALKELVTRVNTVRFWIDQVCIDQDNETEREQQVRLMSRIYGRAQRVIGWLGSHEGDSSLAFSLLLMLGSLSIAKDPQIDQGWQSPLVVLMEEGNVRSTDDLFNPNLRPIQAAARLVQRPWFSRLWIVQEVALATTLELCCGNSSIPGEVFFKAIQVLSSAVSDPPMPWLLKPYRNALKLGLLRAQVSAEYNHSFPHLAQTLSGWNCQESHDRLIALFGLVFRDTQAWFTPNYSMPSPTFYTKFAERHIHMKKGLEILHFAGCGDSSAHKLYQDGDQFILQANPPADDIPSWVPDWRVQSRPLTLSTNLENRSVAFSATNSAPDYKLDHGTLHARAREIDRIKVCGHPYYESLGRRLRITEHETFNDWFNLSKTVLGNANIEEMFASTLVMDGKVAVTERQYIGINTAAVPDMFGSWAARNLDEVEEPCKESLKDGIDDSTRYGYIAEEVCRDRTFFITEAGRLGLGSVHVSPGDSIYLIHGLTSPFTIHRQLDSHVLRGECYVYGLMDGEVQCSVDDTFLHLV
jgi:hypothetical protein